MRSVLDLLKFRFKKLSYGWEKKMVLGCGLSIFVDVFVQFTYVLRRHVLSSALLICWALRPIVRLEQDKKSLKVSSFSEHFI